MRILGQYLLWKVKLMGPRTFYSEEACEVLKKYALGKKCLAEIGCWQGYNTKRIRSVMATDGVFYGVDPYAPGRFGVNWNEIIAHEEVEQVKNGKFCWVKKTDLEAAKKFMDNQTVRFDFIFSDCLNSYEGLRNTWNAWSPLLLPKGIYVIANSQLSVTKNINGAGSVVFTQDHVLKDPNFKCLEIVESFTVLEKIR